MDLNISNSPFEVIAIARKIQQKWMKKQVNCVQWIAESHVIFVGFKSVSTFFFSSKQNFLSKFIFNQFSFFAVNVVEQNMEKNSIDWMCQWNEN